MPPSPFDFIVNYIKNAVPLGRLPIAVRAIFPLLAEFVTSDAVLTDDLRANLQVRILRALKAAGFEGADIG